MNSSFQKLVDRNGRAFFFYLAVSRWICFQMDNIGTLWISGTVLLSYFSAPQDPKAASEMALAITSSLVFLT